MHILPGISRVLTRLAALAASCGEPTNIDLSYPTGTIDVILPTEGAFNAWYRQISERRPDVHTDELGTVLSLEESSDGWTIRLHHQVRIG